MNLRRLSWTLPLVLAVAGCSSLEKLNPFYSGPKDVKNAPAKLKPLEGNPTLQPSWQLRVGKAGEYAFTPGVVGRAVVAAAADGSVVSVEDGQELWRVALGKALSAGVGTGEGLAVVATPKGEVVALDVASGEVKWSARINAEVLATPVVSGDVVVVRSSDSRLFGLSVVDGKRKWVYQRATPALALRSTAGVLVADKSVFAGFPGGKLVAVNLANGALQWEGTVAVPKGATELERVADISSTPAIVGRTACAAAYQGRVTCFDLGNGSTVWGRDISSHAGLALDTKAVYVTDDKGAVHALDLFNGASLWKQADLLNRGVSRPLTSGDYVVVSDSEGVIHLLQRTSGGFVARSKLDGNGTNITLVSLNSGFVAQNSSGMISAFRP